MTRPLALDFAITSFCQARCRSCPRTDSDTGEMESWMIPRHQPYETFKKNTLSLQDKNIQFVKFCGQTGDPMMHPDITDFVDHAFTFANTVMINTNGGLRNTNWYKTVGEKYGEDLTITFAIDGIDADTNWKYREGVNFNKAWDNMVAYAASNGQAEWDFLIFEWNYHQIPEAARLAKSIGVDIEFKLNTQRHGLLDPSKLTMVEEMICQNTI